LPGPPARLSRGSFHETHFMSPVTPRFVVRSRFVIANGMVEQVRAAFRSRPHVVDSAPGFVRMEVLSPTDRPEEIWLMTYWSDPESYREWHGGHTYRESHAGIPKGLKLVGAETEIRQLDFICA
jgi:heme-degrading monooxygenase HmoA